MYVSIISFKFSLNDAGMNIRFFLFILQIYSPKYIIIPLKFIIFYLKFDNFSDICYMNKKNCFDIELESLEVNININYKDVIGKSIIYKL